MEAFIYFIRRATVLRVHPLWYFLDHEEVIDLNKIVWVEHQRQARQWMSEEEILTFAGQRIPVKYEIERISFGQAMRTA